MAGTSTRAVVSAGSGLFPKYRRFALINENDGSFLSRLKPNANPLITAELREWRGRAIPLEGAQIQDVVENLQRQYIDVEVKATFKRRVYEGTQSIDTKRFRVVGVRTEDADDYHLYITNLPREEFNPEEIGLLYRARWRWSCCSGNSSHSTRWTVSRQRKRRSPEFRCWRLC